MSRKTNDNHKSKPKKNLEIERKFLVSGELPELKDGASIIQGYLFLSEEKEMRIRIKEKQCEMTIKINLGGELREEYQYAIPLEDGQKLFLHGGGIPPIEKTRYVLNYDGMDWEIDIFEGKNEGLILAEIELDYSEQKFTSPPWFGAEVTFERKYYNAHLYCNPYQNWKNSA